MAHSALPRPGKVMIRSHLLRHHLVTPLLLCCLVLGVTANDARADDMAKAKAAFANAREQARVNNFVGALESIAEVERYMKHPTVSLLKARALRKLWRLDVARATLATINPTALKKNLRTVLAEEEGKLDAVVKTHGHLKVVVTPATAAITVDGVPYPGGVDRWFEAGKRRIEVVAEMHQPAVRQATLNPGELREVKVVLREAAGTIQLRVPGGLKGASVRVDGKELAIADGARAGDMTSFRAGVGTHEIICARGKRRDAMVVKVELGKTALANCEDLGGGDVGRTVVGWGGVATGAALAGYGVWGIASYFSDQATADDNLNNAKAGALPLNNGLVPGGAIDTNKHWGGALYLVSGLAVSTVSYLMFVRSPSPTPGASAWRWSAPSSAGAGQNDAVAMSRFPSR